MLVGALILFIIFIIFFALMLYLFKQEEEQIEEENIITTNDIDKITKELKEYIALLSEDNRAFIMEEINKMLYEIMILYEINKED